MGEVMEGGHVVLLISAWLVVSTFGAIHYDREVREDGPTYKFWSSVGGFYVWLAAKIAGFYYAWFLLGCLLVGLVVDDYWTAMIVTPCFVVAYIGLDRRRVQAERDADQATEDALRWRADAEDLATQLHELTFDRDLFESYLEAVGDGKERPEVETVLGFPAPPVPEDYEATYLWMEDFHEWSRRYRDDLQHATETEKRGKRTPTRDDLREAVDDYEESIRQVYLGCKR